MKKIIITLFVLLAITLAPTSVKAEADVSLLASSQNAKLGEQFSVAITVTPTSGEKVYTSKVAVSYPSDMLEVVSFSFAPTWLALHVSGYDVVTNDLIIKTAGYPGGFSTDKLFGSIIFRAKKEGVANIVLDNDTQILNGNNRDTFSGALHDSRVIITRAVTQSTNISSTIAIKNAINNNEANNALASLNSIENDPTFIDGNNQLATAISADISPSRNIVYGGIILVLAIIIGFAIHNKLKKPKE